MADSLTTVQSRKWLVTINNPSEHGFTHERIREILSSVRGRAFYWCMCDEQGDECETLHTHIFLYRPSALTAEQIGNLFPHMHRDKCYGYAQENRAYVLKEGEKFNKSLDGTYDYTDSRGRRHQGINFTDTFEEFGECPVEHQGKSRDADIIVSMVRDGASDLEIVSAVSTAYKDIDKIARTRSLFRDQQFANSWRDLEVTYIFGETGVGKTRSVMDKYGYSNCYRVTDYKHPFDTYDGQDVLVLEEYRSQFKISDILNYLDGYPLLLPCRYFNRQACFTKVFIITNIPLENQYFGVAEESRKAFFRRIHKVIVYGLNSCREYDSVNAYMTRFSWVESVDSNEGVIEQFNM